MINSLRDKATFFISGIFILIFLTAFIFFPKKEISYLEKRKLESVPKFSFENFLNGSYQKNLEKSFSDNFFKKEFLVGFNSYKNLLIGKIEQNGIYYAKDGFLMRKPVKKDFLNFSKKITSINNFANKINSKLNVMIVPSTGFILGDKLPILHEEYFDEEFLDFFENKKEKKINLIRLDHLFLKENDKSSLFYKTDHHWTSKAAFMSCNQYLRENNISILKKEDFYIEKYKNFFGTSYSSSGFWLTKPDEIELFNSKYIEDLQIKIDNKKTKGAFFKNFLNTNFCDKDKYCVFFGGNYNLLEIYNQSSENNRKLLIIKDSFANCLAPFLSLKYKYLYMIDLRFYKTNVSDFVKKQNINNVLILYSFENLVSDFNINRLK